MTTLLLTLAFTALTLIALIAGVHIGRRCTCDDNNEDNITHYVRVGFEHITMDIELYNQLDAIGDIWNKEAWSPVHK